MKAVAVDERSEEGRRFGGGGPGASGFTGSWCEVGVQKSSKKHTKNMFAKSERNNCPGAPKMSPKLSKKSIKYCKKTVPKPV